MEQNMKGRIGRARIGAAEYEDQSRWGRIEGPE